MMSNLTTFVLSTRSVNTLKLNQLHFEQNSLRLDIIDNRGKSVQYGRVKAYNLCQTEYVSYIDDDDISYLTGDHVSIMTDSYVKPCFTNSLRINRDERSLLVSSGITYWSLELEKNRKIKPHQTMIIKTDTAIVMSKIAIKLIKHRGWSENSFDYVLRALISLEIGWTYHPLVTYSWQLSPDSLHTRDRIFYYEASNYFFGYVKGINLPSYEKDKSLILASSG